MTTEQQYPGWTKDPDGVWRNPRYPKGASRPKDGVSLDYDAEMNAAVLTVDGHSVPMSFGEMDYLSRQISDARQATQEENSRLWKEKEQIMWVEDGIEPAVYQRGIRMNPRRKK